jgi:hypothetical protein
MCQPKRNCSKFSLECLIVKFQQHYLYNGTVFIVLLSLKYLKYRLQFSRPHLILN